MFTVAVHFLEAEPAAWCIGLALACGMLLWLARKHVAGTTLIAPWLWSYFALAMVAGTESFLVLGAGETQLHAKCLRFAAAMATFCPMMAVLGAKRPQSRAWQFIVLALWVVLCLPAVHWRLAGSATMLHPAWRGFLAILLLVGATNYLPTRFWLANVLFAAGEAALVGPYLAGHVGGPVESASQPILIALPLYTVALLCAHVAGNKRRSARQPLERLWLDFRDMYGVVWGLRVAERIRALAAANGWNARIGWNHFEYDPPLEDRLRQTLTSILRRFVSQEWIAQRTSTAVK